MTIPVSSDPVETPEKGAETAPEEGQTSTETSLDKEMDSVLLELDPEPDPDDLVEVEREGTGDVASGESGEGETTSPLSRPSTEDVEEAHSVLRRDGWTAKDLEGFDDERLITIAAHRKKTQGDVDRLLQEARDSRNETPVENDDDGHTAEPASEESSGVDLDEATSRYAEYLGLDEAGTDLLVQSQKAVLGPINDIISQQREAIESMQSRLLYMDLESARSSLVERFPQVGDTENERWGKVLDKMADIYNEGTDRDTVGVMEDAILLEFREDLKGEAEQAQSSLKNYRANGQPDARGGRAESTSPISEDEREDAVLRMLESSAPDRLERARAIGQQQL